MISVSGTVTSYTLTFQHQLHTAILPTSIRRSVRFPIVTSGQPAITGITSAVHSDGFWFISRYWGNILYLFRKIMKKLYLTLGIIAGLFIGFAYSVQAAPITPISGGGTGTSTVPANGYLLIAGKQIKSLTPLPIPDPSSMG